MHREWYNTVWYTVLLWVLQWFGWALTDENKCNDNEASTAEPETDVKDQLERCGFGVNGLDCHRTLAAKLSPNQDREVTQF